MTSADQPTQGRLPVSVVVATRDRPASLADTLRAVRAAMGDEDELIVVDSASTDPDVGAVGRRLGAAVVRSALPGACRARNLGWKAARHDLVAFTDDDCRPARDWLEQIGRCFATGPDVAFVTGRIVSTDEVAGPARRRAQLSVSLLVEDEPRLLDRPEDADGGGHGANMAWRRVALEALGGFDEALGPGAPLRAAEDADLLWRALETGLAGRYEPAAVVQHHQWRSRRQQLAVYFSYGIGEGALAVKRRRVEGRRLGAGRLAAHFLFRQGIPEAARRLAAGYEMGALADLARAAGAVRGSLTARRHAVAEGHFVP